MQKPFLQRLHPVVSFEGWVFRAALQATSWKALSPRAQQLAPPALSSRMRSRIRCFSSPTCSETAFEGRLSTLEDGVFVFVYGAPRLISRVSGVSSRLRSVKLILVWPNQISILLSACPRRCRTTLLFGLIWLTPVQTSNFRIEVFGRSSSVPLERVSSQKCGQPFSRTWQRTALMS